MPVILSFFEKLFITEQ